MYNKCICILKPSSFERYVDKIDQFELNEIYRYNYESDINYVRIYFQTHPTISISYDLNIDEFLKYFKDILEHRDEKINKLIYE